MLRTLPLLSVLLLVLLGVAQAQTYCQRGTGPILDLAGQCLLSSDYDVANCCFVCPVQNSTGYFPFCMSLYDLGYPTCAQAGSLAARQAACSAIGGSISSGAFMCACNGGTNTSQTNYTSRAPTAVSTLSTPTAPTGTPTGGSLVTAPFLMFSSLLLAYALLSH